MFTMCCQPPKFRMLNPSLVRVSTCFCYRMRNSLLRGLLATPKPTIHRQCNLETSAADFRVLTAAAGCTTAEDKSIFLIDLLIRRSGFVDFLPAEHNNMLFLGGGMDATWFLRHGRVWPPSSHPWVKQAGLWPEEQ